MPRGRLGAGRHPVEDFTLFPPLRVGHDQLEHEPVDLRLRQRIRALMLDRVLGRQHQEELGQWESLAADGDLLLLHRFQQCTLHLGRRAVDLVGQEDIGEDRPLLDREVAASLVVDHGADQVGGQQVGGELDAVESARDGRREGPHRQGLGQPGNSLEQDVAIGEEPDEQALDHGMLADDHLAQLLGDFGQQPAFLDQPGIGLRG